MEPVLTVSIVTYNSAKEIQMILDSLFQSSMRTHTAVYVVDNASNDETVEIVTSTYRDVNLIRLVENVGFGRGHNEVIRNIQSRYHLVANPDVSFAPDLLERAIGYMDENPDIVLLSPRILNPDGSEQHLPKRYPRIKYFIGGRLQRFGWIFEKWRQEYTRANEEFTEPVDIEFATGCFMLMRTKSLKKVGGFDPRYFLHFEDADLTRTLEKRGRITYHPKMEIVHEWKRDNARSRKVFFIALCSMAKYHSKWGIRA